jgi:hypothetical protein
MVVCYTTHMSKRLQVVVADADLERYERTARAAGMTVSEWVRQALKASEWKASSGDVDAKLAVIRTAAAQNSFPVPDIDTLLAEMEASRLAEIEAGTAGVGDA